MQDRAQLLDKNFIDNVKQGRFPLAQSTTTLDQAQLSLAQLLDLFESQVISRHLDLQARILKEQNLGYYTIASCGHESNAAIAKVFRHTDMAFLHYRSSAFMVQRAKHCTGMDPIDDHLLSLVASRQDPCSGGRHKVFGSAPLYVPPQTSTIASHLPKAVGAAMSIARAKELKLAAKLPYDSVILCSFGDGTVNHSTAQGAFNCARWISYQKYPLPIVFICEDNGYGISVRTPATWIEDSFSDSTSLQYLQADGLNLADTYQKAMEAEVIARTQHQPVFLHIKVNRLLGHAGSDIELQYRSEEEIITTEFNDPLLHSARLIIENNGLSADDIMVKYDLIKQQVAEQAQAVVNSPKLQNADDVMTSLIPPKKTILKVHTYDEARRKQVYAQCYEQLSLPRNLCQNINFALTDLMMQYPNIVVFGEDVGKKGGVYRVTAELQKRFGQRRVFDTLLDEQTILGTAIGMAHNGFIPIPEIQFLAYLHNAEDQLRGEAATLPFFSNGQFTNPMVVRIASLGYQKGFGGHFHNDNSLAVLRDIPGLIIACPSNGEDAAKMLRECVRLAAEEQRVVIFIEPIALYMVKNLHQPGDNQWLFQYPAINENIEVGELGIIGDSNELAIISFGNGFYLSRQAEKIIREKTNITVKLIDLRWLAPLNEDAIINAVKDCQNILIVDEERRTGSLSETLMTLLYEGLPTPANIKRITGHDSFIPLGEAWKYVLPSRDDIVNSAILLLKGE